MAIVRNFLSLEEFRAQGTTGAQIISIARFHERAAKEISDKISDAPRAKEIANDHKEIASIVRGIAYRMDPELKLAAERRKARYSK